MPRLYQTRTPSARRSSFFFFLLFGLAQSSDVWMDWIQGVDSETWKTTASKKEETAVVQVSEFTTGYRRFTTFRI